MLKRFDCMRRVPRTFSNSSPSGGVLSVLTCAAIIVILYTQLSMWTSPSYRRRITVHRDVSDDHVNINMNISFVKARCDNIAFQLHDSFTGYTTDFTHQVMRQSSGTGCRVWVNYNLKRVSGEFLFVSRDNKTDMAHVIEDCTFGGSHPFANTKAFRALKGAKLRNIGSSTHDYILKLLQTDFLDEKSYTVSNPYQYTFSYRPHVIHNKRDGTPPSIKQHYIRFRYTWSPLVVEYKAQYYSLYGAVTNIIAYCGGIFTTIQVLHRAYLGGSAFIKDNMYKKL